MTSALKIKKNPKIGRPQTDLWHSDRKYKDVSDLEIVQEVCEFLQYQRLYPDQEFWCSRQKEQNKRFKRAIEIFESCFGN